MAKKKAKRRRQVEKARKQKQTIIAGTAVLILIAIVALFVAQSPGKNAPDVRQERLDLDPVLGNPDAPVTLIEYAAFGCSACKAYHERGILRYILEQYEGQVKLVYRDNPIIMPAYDRQMAEVAQCALDQGNEQFWLMHDWLYTAADQGRTSEEEAIRAGISIGLDESALRACVEAGTHRQTVTYDAQRARDLGLNSTPAFFINDQRVFNPNAIPDMIEEALVNGGL